MQLMEVIKNIYDNSLPYTHTHFFILKLTIVLEDHLRIPVSSRIDVECKVSEYVSTGMGGLWLSSSFGWLLDLDSSTSTDLFSTQLSSLIVVDIFFSDRFPTGDKSCTDTVKSCLSVNHRWAY